MGLRRKDVPFAHGAVHELESGLVLADSYHCSRYNLNTGRLTEAMFHAVFESLRRRLDGGWGSRPRRRRPAPGPRG